MKGASDESTAGPPCAGCPANGLDRRAFLSAVSFAAVVGVLDACGIPTDPNAVTGGTGGPFTVKVADFPALSAAAGVARVEPSGSPTALVRTGASTFAAFSMVCTHQGTTIDITSVGFTCPNHGARFGKDGVWQGGQGTTNLRSFTATFDAATGTVAIARPA
jgi:Rieske Fe-S protein